MAKRFSIKARIRSFKYAFKGIWAMIRSEHNFYIHLIAAAVVIAMGFYFKVSPTEWLWLIVSISSVLTAETFNSAIERLTDLKQPEHDPKAGLIKDLAAGAVLITAITAAVIGLIIFWPYLSQSGGTP